MRPEFLTVCLEDILAIKEHLAEHSASAAARFIESIFTKVTQLEAFPQLGRMVPEYQQPAIRELLYRQYRIVYRLFDDGRISVIAVRSGLLPLDLDL
ncbi:type II toxin-antitoxin system RelE/ParE family toxin [Hymenobacter caeli]|uniref:Plasmid stabilization system protein ParE n=1 Tax=Hymenobacter caeli TaxID=2735894 RepID=A0ABX2FM21_9BACT|nr:type II toxin-antitoxin system RelE/ParE family toxin [Hymenobacter caeli]NRT18208.1 plasmid stabilization system protein ParE [Hymenobacter caeli]